MRHYQATDFINKNNDGMSVDLKNLKHKASTIGRPIESISLTEVNRHQLMDGKLQLYRRPGSPNWQCACSIGGRQQRANSGESTLARAALVARDWYLAQICAAPSSSGKASPRRRGEPATTTPPIAKTDAITFRLAAKRFITEFEALTRGQRSPIYVEGHRRRLANHLTPFFGDTPVAEISAGMIQDYRVHRMSALRRGKPPARSTLHQEIVCLRQILKSAGRRGWIDHLPDMSTPFRSSGKIAHRAWFSPSDLERLLQAIDDRAEHPKKERWRSAAESLRDYVLIMVHTGLRPDEALRLEFRDIASVADASTGERILEIAVRGKRGVGWCKSMPEAVAPFERLRALNIGGPKARVFPAFQRELFNTVLEELEMKTDREGLRRTAYSLRHTYISTRLLSGADIYQVAKNCRTSVDMIEAFYASHIKTVIDASAINVPRRPPSPEPRTR